MCTLALSVFVFFLPLPKLLSLLLWWSPYPPFAPIHLSHISPVFLPYFFSSSTSFSTWARVLFSRPPTFNPPSFSTPGTFFRQKCACGVFVLPSEAAVKRPLFVVCLFLSSSSHLVSLLFKHSAIDLSTLVWPDTSAHRLHSSEHAPFFYLLYCHLAAQIASSPPSRICDCEPIQKPLSISALRGRCTHSFFSLLTPQLLPPTSSNRLPSARCTNLHTAYAYYYCLVSCKATPFFSFASVFNTNSDTRYRLETFSTSSQAGGLSAIFATNHILTPDWPVLALPRDSFSLPGLNYRDPISRIALRAFAGHVVERLGRCRHQGGSRCCCR